MGCCPTLSDKKKPKDKIDYAHLKEFKLIWIDENVHVGDNAKCQPDFNELFGIAKFCETNETAISEIEKDEYLNVMISSGSNYPKIQDKAEKSSRVGAVFIYCYKRECYIHMKNFEKVIDVSNDFYDLKRGLSKIPSDFIREARFFRVPNEHTFFTSAEADEIKKGLSVAVGAKKYSIFFPIGFKAVDPSSILKDKHLDVIGKLGENENEKAEINKRIKELRTRKDLANIIRSYTGKGLYLLINQNIRYGNYLNFSKLREYLLCLKGGLIELGKPVISRTIVYRGLVLEKSDINYSTNNIGQYGLLPSFTSTSLIEGPAKTFMKKQAEDKKNKCPDINSAKR